MLDPVSELSHNEVLLDEGTILEGTLMICFQKLELLGNVGALLIVLPVLMHVGEESPVVKVVDGVLEEGICRSVAPEAMVEPGG